MVDQVVTAEQSKYEKMWSFDDYRERSPGMRFLNDALKRLQMPPGASVVDLGCGTGRVSAELQRLGFDVTAVDIANNACQEFDGNFVAACLWDLPEMLPHFEYGFCADVLEHIPTERIDQCLENIARHTGTVYFQIANFYCHMGDRIGESLHLTVKPVGWWAQRLQHVFDVVDITAQKKHHIAVCRCA